MRHLLIVVLAFLVAVPSVGFAQRTKILTFKVWKQKKIDEARSIVNELKREGKKDDKLDQAQANLDVAKDLSANDYFVLYLSPQFRDNHDAFVQASKALSPRDMADIMGAYQKRLSTTDVSPEVYGAKSTLDLDSPAL